MDNKLFDLLTKGVTIIGTIIEIRGAYILYKFGLPKHLINNVSSAMLAVGDFHNEIKDNILYDKMRKKGFKLLIIGFILQLIFPVISFLNTFSLCVCDFFKMIK